MSKPRAMADGALRLLVVDDDDVDREALRRGLERSGLGAIVDEVESGEAMLEATAECEYDCLFIDYLLADGSVFKWLERLRARPGGDVPAIMLSGHGDERVAVEAMKIGVCDYLSKGEVEPERLLNAVAGALDQARVQRERRERETALERLGLYDELTGLANRRLLYERLGRALAESERTGARFGVLVLDLDGFKEVNDTYGHGAGDHVLVEVAKRILGMARESDTPARLGGDEFAVLLRTTASVEGAVVAARKLQSVLEAPIELEEAEVSVGGSIGVALYPENGSGCDDLMRRADEAMYAAKRDGRGVVVYSAPEDRDGGRRRRIANDVQRVAESDRLLLEYQPQIDLVTGEVTGVEALVRWRHPDLGLLAPADFIPAAERSSAIRGITLAVLDLALEQAARWASRGRSLPVSVNLSARVLEDESMAGAILERAERHGVAPSALTVEVTETGAISESGGVSTLLRSLGSAGARISLDDFGTGYGSLRLLRDLPVDEIKLDPTFTGHQTLTSRGRSIVESVVALGRGLGADVVAEGIESRSAWEALLELGCRRGQGYFIGIPLSAAALELWLDAWPAARAGYLAAGAA